jgi:hypothetical protein
MGVEIFLQYAYWVVVSYTTEELLKKLIYQTLKNSFLPHNYILIFYNNIFNFQKTINAFGMAKYIYANTSTFYLPTSTSTQPPPQLQ